MPPSDHLKPPAPPMKRWRIAQNEWNLKSAPWSEAVGIEEVDDTDVPAILCWFTRPRGKANAKRVVDLHNSALDRLERR